LDVAVGNDNAIRIRNENGSNTNGLSLAVGSGSPWMDITEGKEFRIKHTPYANIGDWNNGSNARFVIDPNGNIGIGTASPNAKLYVSGGTLSHAFDNGGNWRSLGSYGSASGTYTHIKTNLSYNSYKMTTFRATGYYPYSSTGHGYLGCYTYGATPGSPYGQSNLNLGDYPIAHSQYYASDAALVLVFQWPTTYNGFWLEYLSTGGSYGNVTDVNVISYTQSNATTGVY